MLEIRNFDIAFEEKRAEELLNIDSLEEYRLRREALISYNTDQMITNLGERFNVILSTYEYEIKNGELWGKNMNEPFMDSLKRGRDYRRKNGNPIDYRREDAEIIGFEKIQKTITDENTPEGTIILSISPPGLEGSTYTHNFIDIHTKKLNEKGEAYMESQRVSSGLNVDEYREKISAFAEIEIDENDPAVSFLENPIIIEGAINAEDIKFYLYREHDYMDEKSFEVIKKSVLHLTEEYAKSLVNRPNDKNYHRLLFNTILNKADEAADRIKFIGIESIKRVSSISTDYSIQKEIQVYGYREVKKVKAGCGLSGGFELEGQNSPYSVSEFNPKTEKILCCTCPFCKKEVEAKIARGKIECPNCKKSAKWED